jgi:chitinase
MNSHKGYFLLSVAVAIAGCGGRATQTVAGASVGTPMGAYLQTLDTGQYLSAVNGGGGAITATAPWMRGWEHVNIYDASNSQLNDGDLVYLAASTGQFWSAHNGGGSTLSATGAAQRGWEAFHIARLAGPGPIQAGDQIALRTSLQGDYVSAVNGGGGAVNAEATAAQDWETFIIALDGTAGGGTPLEEVLSQSTFESMFPDRNPFYTYQDFVQAATAFPSFAASGSGAQRKREVAAFLANVNHETGGLYYINETVKELRCVDGVPSCPCASGQYYYGRGPLQITGNENYCAASQAILGDPTILEYHPGKVSQDGLLAWETALWFWTSTSCHDDIVNNEDFAGTIETINGPYECGGANPDEVQDRVQAYLSFCQLFGVDPGSSLYC